MTEAMQRTMKFMCDNIQGCVFGYTQSDEITLVLTDYEKLTTDAWFGYNIQKCASVAASMATYAFNKFFAEGVSAEIDYVMATQDSDVEGKYLEALDRCRNKVALFDARVFSIPKEEVCNCLIWRQKDAIRNSIESAGYAHFSHKKLHQKNCNQVLEMLKNDGIDWEEYPADFRRGSACYKQMRMVGVDVVINPEDSTSETSPVCRMRWTVDTDICLFTDDRNFIERWL